MSFKFIAEPLVELQEQLKGENLYSDHYHSYGTNTGITITRIPKRIRNFEKVKVVKCQLAKS